MPQNLQAQLTNQKNGSAQHTEQHPASTAMDLRSLIGRPAVLYFFLFAALSAPGRFFSVFLRSFAGLSDGQIGLVLGAPVLLSMLTRILVGIYADSRKDGKERSIFFLTLVGAGLFQLMLLTHALPAALQFAYILVVCTFGRAAMTPLFPCLDSYTLEYLGKGREKEDADLQKTRYGEERLWGAVSWGIMSVIIGFSLDRWGFVRTIFPANLVFSCSFALLVAATIVPSWRSGGFVAVANEEAGDNGDEEFLAQGQESVAIAENGCESNQGSRDAAPFQLGEDDERGDGGSTSSVDPEGGSHVEDVKTGAGALAVYLLSNPRSLVFLLTLGCVNFGTALVEGLVFLYFADMKATNGLMGLTVCVTVVFEIPLFYVSKWLSSRCSAPTLMLGGMFCYVTRVIGYTLVSTGEHVIFFEPLHGVTYALIQLASVQEMSRLAPPHLQTTGQSFLAIAKSVGSFGGNVGGGYIMGRYGPKVAYRCAAGLVSAASVVYAISSYCGSATSSTARGALRVEAQDIEESAT